MIAWLKRRFCGHSQTQGIANYYDRDTQVFLHLIECRSCGLVLIERR